MTTERPHGIVRLRLGGCCCERCQQADVQYRSDMAAERGPGIYLSGEPVQQHIHELWVAGLTYAEIAAVADVLPSQVEAMSRGIPRVRSTLAARVLAIPLQAVYTEDVHGYVDGRYVWALIDELAALPDWSKPRVAKEVLGVRQLELGRRRVIARSAEAVERAYRRYVGKDTGPVRARFEQGEEKDEAR